MIEPKTLTIEIELKPMPKYGDLIPIQDFYIQVQDGDFTDDDGYGYYATEFGMTWIKVRPYDFTFNMPVLAESFTHVAWFNK